jgi:hypothetical protein
LHYYINVRKEMPNAQFINKILRVFQKYDISSDPYPAPERDCILSQNDPDQGGCTLVGLQLEVYKETSHFKIRLLNDLGNLDFFRFPNSLRVV